jgi:hypothetical protein
MRARTPLWTLLRPNEAYDRKSDDIGATPRKTPLTTNEKGKRLVQEKTRMKTYFWWTKTYFATATDYTSSNIISRDIDIDRPFD